MSRKLAATPEITGWGEITESCDVLTMRDPLSQDRGKAMDTRRQDDG